MQKIEDLFSEEERKIVFLAHTHLKDLSIVSCNVAEGNADEVLEGKTSQEWFDELTKPEIVKGLMQYTIGALNILSSKLKRIKEIAEEYDREEEPGEVQGSPLGSEA